MEKEKRKRRKEENKGHLVYNALKCNSCGEIVVSRWKHNAVTCKCKNVLLDGGLEYRNMTVGEAGAEDLAVFSNEPFEKVRQYFYRWNPDKGNYISLMDISDEWLENILSWYLSIPLDRIDKQIAPWAFCLYIREKQYRNIDLELLNAA